MQLGWIQTAPVYGEPRVNLSAVEAVIREQKADLWILPELFSTGYLFGSREELESLCEPVPYGPTVGALVDLAGESETALVAGIAERGEDGKLYNTAVAIDAGGVRARYRKIHLFDLETIWFDSGNLPNPVVPLAGARVGLMICFDWRFPEVARSLALQGAQILAHPSNIVQSHCQAAMVTRAIENRVFTITANRVGFEKRDDWELSFTGGSRIVDPDGRLMSDGPAKGFASGVVEIDPAVADDKRVTLRNDLFEDRNPACYRLDEPPAS